MRFKQIIINIAVILVAFLIFVLWHQNHIQKPAQDTFANMKYYKVYLITTDKGFQYWSILNQGAQDMANLIGVKYLWEAPNVRSTDEQIEIIKNAVDNGADALIVAADDPKRISSVIEDAKARNVKVVYVDSPAYEEAITTLTTDNYAAGVQGGHTMLEILDRMGIKSGSIGIVNLTDKANTKLREDGFRSVLESDPRFKLLDTKYSVSDKPEATQIAAEQFIKENSDLVALFGTSEGTSIGIGEAIKANDNKYVGVGFDKTEVMLKLLHEGSIKAIIAQNQYSMGYLGMAEAVAAILGKDTGPDYFNTGVSVIEGNQ